MKKFRFLTLFLPLFLLVWLLAGSSCANKNYRNRHSGYDSQQWVPRKHKDVPLRTYTGYPRERRRK